MLEYKPISVKHFIFLILRKCWSQQILFCSWNKDGVHSELVSIHVLISRPIKVCQPSLVGVGLVRPNMKYVNCQKWERGL